MLSKAIRQNVKSATLFRGSLSKFWKMKDLSSLSCIVVANAMKFIFAGERVTEVGHTLNKAGMVYVISSYIRPWVLSPGLRGLLSCTF